MNYHLEDFTESGYRELLRVAKKNYSFVRYGFPDDGPHILWRHDMDYSIQRCHRLAQIESEEGICSTYLLNLHSEFFHWYEKHNFSLILQIMDMGHELGLHFDCAFYEISSLDILEKKLRYEKGLMEQLFNRPVRVFSFHNPDVGNALQYDQDEIAGMINTYGRKMKQEYSYCSDSNGYWRFRRLKDVLEQANEKKLHILTHPGWWQEEVMTPRDRISRCIDGRAAAVHSWYDRTIEEYGRVNVGAESK